MRGSMTLPVSARGPEGRTLPGLRMRRPAWQAGCAALLAHRGRLRCRRGAPLNAAPHLTASRRPGEYAGLPLCALRCSPAHMRPVRPRPSGPAPTGFLGASKANTGAGQGCGRAGTGANVGAEQRSAARGSLPLAAGRREAVRCSARSAASTAASQPPLRSEQHRAASPQARPPTPERTGLAARSLARSTLERTDLPAGSLARSCAGKALPARSLARALRGSMQRRERTAEFGRSTGRHPRAPTCIELARRRRIRR